jgi:hypothetical protein
MKHVRKSEEGMALVLAIFAIIVILGAVTVVVQRVHSEKRMADFAVNRAVLDEACKAGIDVAIERIWNQYLETNGNTTGNLASYRVFINDLTPTNEDLNFNGVQDDNEWDFNGNGTWDQADPFAFATEDDPLVLSGGARLTNLTISRSDDLTGSNLTINVTARYGGEERSAVQTVRVSGELFEGFEYGIMANNINCILCHAQFHSLDLARNTDPNMYGEFDRIKVATLESLMIRTNENINSHIAGTVYTRGSVYNQSNNQLNANQIAGSTLKSYEFSDSNGKINQDGSGAMSVTNLGNAGTDDEGLLEQFSNLYMNYPEDKNLQTDGTLPSKFPAPYPDENGNRRVDDDEFEEVVNSSNGSIIFELPPDEATGSVTAGVAYGVPKGSAYAGNGLPSSSNNALQSLSDNGSYEGNLILVGTEDDPIVINNTVAVDGDLVIKGPIKGWGQLLVRNNVYVMGDVTYADAPGEFGKAADGTDNGFAVTAGGSIMMGDYLTIRGKQHPNDNSKYPGGGFIDVRDEHKTKNVSSGGNTTQVAYGYFDDGVIDAGWEVDGQPQMSFTSSETMLFNQLEYQKAQADPSYTPRYYRIRPSQPLYRYTANDEHTVRYDSAGVATFSPTGDYTIHDLNPDLYWVNEDQLRNWWFEDEMQRSSSGEPFRFDGLLYSNNAIFGITRSKGRHNSNTFGRMVIRGSIVSADLGMLVPGANFSVPRDALDLFYDKRVADFFRVEDTTRVEIRRLAYRAS